MRINHLSLTNFRNYARLELAVPSGAILLYGDNAQGKTSLLEAVYYLATSKSPYTRSDRELINWLVEKDPMPFARLVAEIQTAQGLKRVEVTVVNQPAGRGRRIKKEVRVNGIKRRVMELLGQVRVVLFLPRDLSLVEGSPSLRRRYLNVTLCQTDLEYCSAVSRYEKTLRQRNALLREFQERGGRGDYAQFDFWDEQLADDGAIIIEGRYELIRELERRAQSIHSELSGEDEHLRLRYEPGFDVAEAGSPRGQLAFGAAELGAAALPQLGRAKIAERFRSALMERRKRDARRGSTSIGPQRDEMRFLVNRRDLGMYGSRGQNRTAVLALKLAELDWMRDMSGEWPILLLDEVAAELDPHRRAYLLERIHEADQVLLTTTEPTLLTDGFLSQAEQWHVKAGTIVQEEA